MEEAVLIKVLRKLRKSFPKTAVSWWKNFLSETEDVKFVRYRTHINRKFPGVLTRLRAELPAFDAVLVFHTLCTRRVVRCPECGSPSHGFVSKNPHLSPQFCTRPCALSSELRQRKAVATNLAKYGVRNPMMYPEIQDKLKVSCKKLDYTAIRKLASATYLARTGYSHPSKNPEVERKRVCTMQARFGVDHASQSPICQETRRVRSLAKCGVDHHMKTAKGKANFVNGMLDAHGVSWAQQSLEIRNKSLKSSWAVKVWVNPVNGGTLFLQGYEPEAATQLSKSFQSEGYVVQTTTKTIPWTCSAGTEHRYHPDFVLFRRRWLGGNNYQTSRIAVEVKSFYTIRGSLEKFNSVDKTLKNTRGLGGFYTGFIVAYLPYKTSPLHILTSPKQWAPVIQEVNTCLKNKKSKIQ